MAKPPAVEYVITKPSPASWWKRNKHLVLLCVGLLVGAWMANDAEGNAAGSTDRPVPSRSTTSTPTGSKGTP